MTEVFRIHSSVSSSVGDALSGIVQKNFEQSWEIVHSQWNIPTV